ncbi:hypothetical protein [Halorussus halophilus]|uniref:hypothetical protein n=1 Tax=Halorussus halophilus TaxID=2650975 RepID=UPI00130180A3|nr:hypothetical protein [Halorussus halophilus]
MVSRRNFLALGASSLSLGLAGCTSSLPFGGPPEVREQSDDSIERKVPAPFSEPAKPFASLVVGEGSNQTHQVWVWNRTDGDREIGVRIGPEDGPWFEQSFDFVAEDALAIDLRPAREYELGVQVEGREKEVTVEKSQFDCNESATDVLVKKTETTTQTISTQMGCGGDFF